MNNAINQPSQDRTGRLGAGSTLTRALDPVTCTRCRREVTADDPARPEHLDSRVFLPANPRPTLTGAEVWWKVEADYHQPGTVSALLCRPCIDELSDWLYRPAG